MINIALFWFFGGFHLEWATVYTDQPDIWQGGIYTSQANLGVYWGHAASYAMPSSQSLRFLVTC